MCGSAWLLVFQQSNIDHKVDNISKELTESEGLGKVTIPQQLHGFRLTLKGKGKSAFVSHGLKEVYIRPSIKK